MEAQNHDTLDKKQQSLIAISALTAKGDSTELKKAIAEGLEAGLTINEIKEAEVQLYAYCGFPRSLNGINALMAVIKERKEKGIQDVEGKDASPIPEGNKYQTGKATLQKLTGKEEKAPAGANAFAPAIDTFLKEHLFADIFSRDVLNYTQRELISVSALASMNGVESQLQAHIGIAMNVGIMEQELTQAFVIIEKNIGKKEADIARQTLAKVIAAKQKTDESK